MDRAEALYRDVLGLDVIGRERGRHVFFKTGEAVILVFNADETLKGTNLPAHGDKGPGHVALRGGLGPTSFLNPARPSPIVGGGGSPKAVASFPGDG